MSFTIGTAHNGRRAMLQSGTHTGEVGVRERGNGQIELAWFGKPPKLQAPDPGTLDGVAITITGLRARPLISEPSHTLGGDPNRMIVATASFATVPLP